MDQLHSTSILQLRCAAEGERACTHPPSAHGPSVESEGDAPAHPPLASSPEPADSRSGESRAQCLSTAWRGHPMPRCGMTATRRPSVASAGLVLTSVALALTWGIEVVASKTPVTALRRVDLAKRAPDARALDGSPSHFYFRPSADGSATSWVIFMEGGGDCTDAATCEEIVASGQGSSKGAALTHTPRAPLLLPDAAANPRFYASNHVYVPYLTGDFHAGQRCGNASDIYLGKYWFCGHRHLEATLDTLLHEHSLGNASLVIFSGCSTGGMGVFRNLDYVRAKLLTNAPLALTVGAAFSGFYFFQSPFTGPGAQPVQDFGAAGFERYFGMHKAYVDQSCEAALAPRGAAWMCQQANYSQPYVTTPIFISEDQTDKVVMSHHAGVTPPPWSSNPAMAAYAAIWQANMSAAIADFAARPTRGVFSPACWNHCGNHRGTPRIGGIDVVQAFDKWVQNVVARSGRGITNTSAYVNIDTCGASPCNPTCAR